MQNSLGTVENGKIADLVLLHANPLEDVRNTQEIDAALVAGGLVDRTAIDKLLDDAEAAAAKEALPPR